jgi:hypothetical protein
VPKTRDLDWDDELDDGKATKRDRSEACAQKGIKPMFITVSVAFLIVVCVMIFSKGKPSGANGAPDSIVNQAVAGQYPQASAVAWRYVGKTYTCPKCGWQGNRMAIDELGNCVCPQCGYCSFKKNVQTSRGVDAIASASPNLTVVKPIGIEVKDMLGGVVACAVYGNSWAEKAGMKQGDFIVRFNHVDVVYVNQLMDLVTKAPPEKRVTTTVIRKGKKVKFDVWVGEGELEGVVVPTPATAVHWGMGMGQGPGYGPGQGFGRTGGYAACPGCGFRMLCGQGQSCPLCPRCNNSMTFMNQGAGGSMAFQGGAGQNTWCPPGGQVNQATGAAFQTGTGQNAWCPPQ